MLSLEEKHDWLRAFSPANLRYVAAIRGYVPADQSQGFTYAQLHCGDAATLIALAAANPEGVFFGFDGDADKLEAASAAAEQAGLENLKFAQADSAALTEALQAGAIKPMFDYVVANLVGAPASDIAPAVTLAGNLAGAGGLVYVAYPVTPIQIESQTSYIAAYQPGQTNTDVAQAAASAGQLAFAGSAKLKHNYIEFVVHPHHQPKLVETKGQPAFESLKDIAIGARVRHDLWVKPGATQSDHLPTLLQNFSFGMASAASNIEPQFKYFDKKIDLATPLFTRLLNTLAETPHTVGDLVAHTDFQNAQQDDIVSGVQMLAAIGMIEPVRASYQFSGSDFTQPHFAGSYNQQLRDQTIGIEGALLAAPMIGRPVLGTAPMVMTLQALDQGGLSGAEEMLDQMLLNADPAVKNMIGMDMTDAEARRNTAYRLLENVVQSWLQFCYVNGIMSPS